jgi:hypothetical protein
VIETGMAVTLFIVAVTVIAGTVLASLLIEGMRTKPNEPSVFILGGRSLPVQHLNVGGLRLRCVKTGNGPPLVLLRTLRTQLDIFQKIIPEPATYCYLTGAYTA